MTPIIMPQIGQDSPRGTIVEWRKRENDPVVKGEVVLTVESDKAVFEVTAERAGVLLQILHPAGAQVEILQPVAYLGEVGETVPVSAAPSVAGPALACEGLAKQAVAGLAEAGTSAPELPAVPFALASPAVRRLARERQIDLRHVRGTGPGGRITLQDVEAASRSPGSSAV